MNTSAFFIHQRGAQNPGGKIRRVLKPGKFSVHSLLRRILRHGRFNLHTLLLRTLRPQCAGYAVRRVFEYLLKMTKKNVLRSDSKPPPQNVKKMSRKFLGHFQNSQKISKKCSKSEKIHYEPQLMVHYLLPLLP